MPNVMVIGAGILGSSIAVNLAQHKDCKVTVLEAAQRPAEGATAKSWAWLNANRKTPNHYADLNKAGMEEWQKLNTRSSGGEKLAEFPGTIYLGDKRELNTNYPSKKLEAADVKALESEVASSKAEAGGRLYEQEGYGYPVLAVSSFLEEAKSHGAEVHYSAGVQQLEAGESTTGVVTSSGRHEADVVILAAGLGVPRLASQVGAKVPLTDKPGTLTILTQPMPRFLDHILINEEAYIVQRRDGEVMISFFKAAVSDPPPAERDSWAASLDGGIADRVVHSAQESQKGHEEEAAQLLNETDEIAEKEISRAAALVPALQNASLGSFSVAKYPYPQDALPIVGWLPGKEGKVYVAVTHSGATLGPLLGRLVAEEILGREQAVLQHYRPGRDFSNTSHLY